MRDRKIIAERMERRRAARGILRIWGNTLYLLNRLEKEREAFRAWADDARFRKSGAHARNDQNRRALYHLWKCPRMAGTV